jgi:hypothetical protein
VRQWAARGQGHGVTAFHPTSRNVPHVIFVISILLPANGHHVPGYITKVAMDGMMVYSPQRLQDAVHSLRHSTTVLQSNPTSSVKSRDNPF